MSALPALSDLPELPKDAEDVEDEPIVSTVAPAVASPAAGAFARELALAAEDGSASDILVLDIAALTTLADYFVICTADNERMLNAIVRNLDERATRLDMTLLRQEGGADSGWILMDFGDVIVHTFGKRERDFYQLDRLWADAPRILVIQ